VHVPARDPEGKPRVLVIDDDSVVVTVLRHGLEAEGVEVVSAADGAAGLRAVIDNLLELDLLITDLQMPGLDGASVVRIIRAEGGERELPILVLATSVSERDRALLAQLGVTGVVEKNDGSERLVRTAAELARRSRQARAPPPAAEVVPLAPIRLARAT
jgi:CheY-like chemotaxis protein